MKTVTQALRKIHVGPDDAVIVGSGILGALNIRTINDVDIVVSQQIFHRIASEGYTISHYVDGSGKIVLDGIEVMYSWYGKTIEELQPNAQLIDGIWYMSLLDVRMYKQQQGRPKDVDDIALIDAYLTAHGNEVL